MNNIGTETSTAEEPVRFSELSRIANGARVLMKFPEKVNHQATAFARSIMLESLSRKIFHACHTVRESDG